MFQEQFLNVNRGEGGVGQNLTLVGSEAGRIADTPAKKPTLNGRLPEPGCPAAQPVVSRVPGAKPDLDDPVVVKVLVGQLYREVRRLPDPDRRVMRLVSGIGCRPHTHLEAAKATGLTERGVRLSLDRSMRSLRVGFGVELVEAA